MTTVLFACVHHAGRSQMDEIRDRVRQFIVVQRWQRSESHEGR